ncbi:MAG: SCO family protein [Gammaproteobacteria bacterium]
MKRRELFSGFDTVAPGACLDTSDGNRCLANLIPNALFRTHENEEVRFYDDVLKGKTVMVMMMYTTCETACPAATQRMVEIHRRYLADRMGKDLFLCNITLKPHEDDPAAMAAYAKAHGALLPGWTFLTGDRYDIDTLRYTFFSHDHIGIDLDDSVHAGMIKIINEPLGRWLHADAFVSTRTLLEHIEWAKPLGSYEEELQKNIRLQQQIDADVEKHGYRRTV